MNAANFDGLVESLKEAASIASGGQTDAIVHVGPIVDEAAYQTALAQYEGYFDNEPEPGTYDGKRFVALGEAIREYETRA
jgi:hypothetical protein